MQESRIKMFSIIIKPSCYSTVGLQFVVYKIWETSYNKNRLKVFLKHTTQNVFKNTFTLESLIYYYFQNKS
jgi:hypothetical protein